MNKMIASKPFRHGKAYVAQDGEFEASDTDAQYYEGRGIAKRAPEKVEGEQPEVRRRGRPPSYQTRQLQAEPVKTEVQPLSTQELPPESKTE